MYKMVIVSNLRSQRGAILFEMSECLVYMSI